MQATWRRANPLYEQAEGVVAGVPELADYDVILDAGSSAADDPESAVPFDLKRPDGKVEKRPGNFFFLTETALWGTEAKFTAADVKADLDDDGKVSYGEALPDANHLVAAARDFARNARELDASAAEVDAERERRLHGARGDDADDERVLRRVEEQPLRRRVGREGGELRRHLAPVGHHRHPVRPRARVRRGAADGRPRLGGAGRPDRLEPDRLRAFAEDLRDREADGERFTPEQADALGSEAQERAEAIAGQVSQAAAKLNVDVEA